MLTWAYVWYATKSKSHSQLGHVIPMFCDVAIFYYIACAVTGAKL
jgi:hypothetical protein